jgi:mercuric ion transport protein
VPLKEQEGAVVQQVKWSEKPWLRWITLFITSSTLLCCALPITLVLLGFGSVVASLNYNIPGLVFLAENKLWTLALSALLLLCMAWIIWRPNQSCPTDPKLGAYCKSASFWNKRVFFLSVGIWCIGVFFSFALLPIRRLLNI